MFSHQSINKELSRRVQVELDLQMENKNKELEQIQKDYNNRINIEKNKHFFRLLDLLHWRN